MAAAYIGEILRSGIQSVESGQLEASRALGFSYPSSMRLVVIPQGIRRVLPALVNQFISLLKASSLVYFLGLIASQRELFQVGRDLNAQTGNLSPLVAAGLFYLALTIPLTHLVNYIDRRLGRGRPDEPTTRWTLAGTPERTCVMSDPRRIGLAGRQASSSVLRYQPGAARRRPGCPGRHHGRRHRPVRLGQVDVAAHPEPAATNPIAATSCWTAAQCSATIRTGCASGSAWCSSSSTCFRTAACWTTSPWPRASSSGLSTDAARELALEQLDRVGLRHKADVRPGTLSGGQQQRVAIARALAMAPQVMFFDEATSALDPELVKGILALITELGTAGMTMVVVTHEMGFARSAADSVVFMDRGVVVESGPPGQLFEAAKTERLRQFLGTGHLNRVSPRHTG